LAGGLLAVVSNSIAIARTGLSAATLRLDSAAHNLANALTPGFRRQQVNQHVLAGGGVSANVARTAGIGANLAADLVDQRMALYSFKANLLSIKAQDQMLRSLLDLRA
jgi:flagellar hook protein FlgE